MLTATSIMNPTFLAKVRAAMAQAFRSRAPVRVRNRFGLTVLCIEWVEGKWKAWADFGREVTHSLRKAFQFSNDAHPGGRHAVPD
ncbi:hypothetical protein [Pseudomonas sp. PDM13]|uniref:hypothetical protein n=1 Tax=Pseudomonas sp. PDM13 TaxID=2769255 RepID=UPI0021DF7364|nr:hypothetical protein [Pseudomonas sp. PDM13]MCU9947536.1 hypothetical protein [Pseudomonas sp. PDM13]